MLQLINSLLSYIGCDMGTKGKHPLTRENAYALSSIGKKGGHYSDVTKKYQEYILEEIKSAAKFNRVYLMIDHPSYATPTDKEDIVDFIAELGYTICFKNDDIIVVSWRYSPGDFKLK